MPESHSISPELLDCYLAGTATSSEASLVEAWMYEKPEHRHLVAMLRSVDTLAVEPQRLPITNWEEIDTSHAKQVLLTRVGLAGRVIPLYTSTELGAMNQATKSDRAETASPSTNLRSSPLPRLRRFSIARIGMICAVMIGVIGLGFTLSRARSSAMGSGMMTYSTGNAQRATIQFADGSRVTLNVASRIQVPENFSQGNRIVRLSGEAYFEVAHAERSPFVVEAGDVRTRVLGTEFGIRAYQPPTVRVAVRSGRVAVNDRVLNAYDVASTNTNGTVVVQHDQSLDAALAFTTERLMLNGVALRDAVADLNRWYDVDIRFGDEAIGMVPMYAILRSGSISDLVEILRNTFKVSVVQQGRVLTITSTDL